MDGKRRVMINYNKNKLNKLVKPNSRFSFNTDESLKIRMYKIIEKGL